MEIILQLLLTPLLLSLSAKLISGVYLRNMKAAFWTSFWIIIVGLLVGWLITLLLNVVTLGVFWIVGLGIITRTIAYAVVIEIIDAFRADFDTKGFMPSLWISVMLAIGWGVIDWIF